MNSQPTILLVDDNIKNLQVMEEIFASKGFRLYRAQDGLEALKLIENECVDLVLLDVAMPGMNGFEVCERIKKSPKYQLTPVIMITGLPLLDYRLRGIEVGADEFLSKPVNFRELIARINSLLKTKSITDQMDQVDSVFQTLVEAVEARDPYTRKHSERVGTLAVDIGKLMHLPFSTLEDLKRAGSLHDIGKIGIPDDLLKKAGKLTDEEFILIKSHTTIGFEICRHLNSTRGILELILHHHEKLDGTGYPKGLKGDQIPLPVRIIAVADCFDALTSTRSYRGKMPHSEAFDIMDREVRQNHLDGDVVRLLRCLMESEIFIDS